ncbi:MAG: DEAD/DEAH box helicase [Spirochaetaceae bacterium]|jgi:ATP-dependent RNA helicase DeaD|nr:DEAD/DEAH box helicase [Spirochaetaceae bacterium]
MTISNDHPFASFGLSEGVLAALTHKGFEAPSSIQAIALPRLLADQGHLIVKARTGTGKTAAFGIPLVERLTQGGHEPRALILTPTRELALQVSKEIASFAPGPYPRITAVYGGASIRNQILDLKRGTEIVVGTPGRIMDLMERKVLNLSAIEWFILDEADEMLDMGFFEDVETILRGTRNDRRVALFSATMPEAILKIVREYIGEVEILEDTVPEDEKPAVDQHYMVLKKEDRLEGLRRLIDEAEDFYGLVFCATKAGADELARRLVEGGYPAEAIHGDLTQEARERTLRRFRSKLTTILVATDVAARGIDIERLTHVINWDLPNDRETYVHRIGRTGRAGRRGIAVSMVLPSERGRMNSLSRSMERVLGSRIEWMRLPPVKSVMDAVLNRIRRAVIAAAPQSGDTPEAPGEEEGSAAAAVLAPPLHSRLGRELIDALGAEGAVLALIAGNYGESLDFSRYSPVTELNEFAGHETERKRGKHPFDEPKFLRRHGRGYTEKKGEKGRENKSRVYIGLGRRHGASAGDVARLLMRAGGVPGRMVDAIEMKDYCAFATMPEDAARRAYAFSRNTPKDPSIKPASPPEHP